MEEKNFKSLLSDLFKISSLFFSPEFFFLLLFKQCIESQDITVRLADVFEQMGLCLYFLETTHRNFASKPAVSNLPY